jgi:uncharacterized protein (DUF2252 family)
MRGKQATRSGMLKIATSRARLEAARGRALRRKVPRSQHGAWQVADDRSDPLELLDLATRDRLQYLVPLRNARMFDSPFAFYRGSAIIMAADLATTPRTNLFVEACGDAHCSNFGGFATPERNTIFDVNDFDETLTGPWEWDIKRLVTSLILAGRHNGHSERQTNVSALAAAQAYRIRMREFAVAPALEVWYSKLDATKILNEAKVAAVTTHRNKVVVEAATTSIQAAIEKLTERKGDSWRFRDDPPILYHSAETDQTGFDIEAILSDYEKTLPVDVYQLLKRYKLADKAIKIVGVGSVGTRCGIALLVADDHDAILLQIKEATVSVLERHLEPSPYANHGERVVRGQRMMQAASDLFLGWAASGNHDFYVRQFKDMKASAELDDVEPSQLREYARYCGWALAAAHARSGSAPSISGYMGRSTIFDRALLQFAILYAEQSESDYERFCNSVRTGDTTVAEDVA